VRKSDLLAELTDVLSDGVSQDLWLLSVGIDNNPWGQYQPYLWQLMRKLRGSGKNESYKLNISGPTHSKKERIKSISDKC